MACYKYEIIFEISKNVPWKFCNSGLVSTDASEYKKLLFLLLPALFLSFALFFSAFRVLDCMKWYFKTLKVSPLFKNYKNFMSAHFFVMVIKNIQKEFCRRRLVLARSDLLWQNIFYSNWICRCSKYIKYTKETFFFSQLSLKNFETLLSEVNQSIFMAPWCVLLFLRLFEKLCIKNIPDFRNIIGRYSTAASDPGVAKFEPRFNMSHNIFWISWPWT